MIASERHQLIKSLLERQGSVRTIDLATNFQVTGETIRRDLKILEKEGHLTCVHGGASTKKGRLALRSFLERSTVNTDAKLAIATAALDFIEPGKTVAFDSSTTAHTLVSVLPQQALRVLTNASGILNQLMHFDHIDLISTGGRYHRKTQTFNGPECMDTLERYNVNTAFISCIGFDPARGISEGFEQQAVFKEQLVAHSEQTILLADASKFGKRSDYFFAQPGDIAYIITDDSIKPIEVQALRSTGCEVIVAKSQSPRERPPETV